MNRLDPQKIFSPSEWAILSRRNDALSMGLVLHAWAIIIAAFCLFALWPNPLTWLIAVMLIGTRQLGLAILMHEAAHGGLHRDRRINDAIGKWLCAAPIGASLHAYRPYHLRHHRYTQTKDDPDLSLSAAFPVSRASMRRKVLRDLFGVTFYRQRLVPLFLGVRAALSRRHLSRDKDRAIDFRVVDLGNRGQGAFLIVNLGLIVVLALFHQAHLYFVLWLAALATWFPLVTRIRNIGEHACIEDGDNLLRQARDVRANALERLFIAPYWVHYHLMHHLFMYLPCYRLEAAHLMLAAKNYGAQMEVQPSYRAVMAKVLLPEPVQAPPA